MWSLTTIQTRASTQDAAALEQHMVVEQWSVRRHILCAYVTQKAYICDILRRRYIPSAYVTQKPYTIRICYTE